MLIDDAAPTPVPLWAPSHLRRVRCRGRGPGSLVTSMARPGRGWSNPAGVARRERPAIGGDRLRLAECVPACPGRRVAPRPRHRRARGAPPNANERSYLKGRTMADVRQPRATADPGFNIQPTPVTGWAGWIIFSGILMIMLGMFHALMGVVALFKDDYYLVAHNGLVLSLDYTTWGWIHLVIGLVAVLAGVGVMVGQMWARV